MSASTKNPRIVRMTSAHKKAVLAVRNGADVFSYAIARLLREVEATKPGFVDIVDAMGEYDAAQQQPYFGAIALAPGIDWARGKRS